MTDSGWKGLARSRLADIGELRARAERAEALGRNSEKAAAGLYLDLAAAQATLDRVRELRDEAEATPEGYLIDRTALDEVLEGGEHV